MQISRRRTGAGRGGWRRARSGRQHSGVSVPAQLAAVTQNARALAARGDVRGGCDLLDQALDAASMMVGPDHPEVLSATRLLASLRRQLGELAEARRLLEEGLAAGQFTLGEDHPLLLSLAYDLATLADELGNRHEARRNYTRIARYGPRTLGAGHPTVRAARRYLGDETPEPAPGGPAVPGPTEPAQPPYPDAEPPAPPAGPEPAQLRDVAPVPKHAAPEDGTPPPPPIAPAPPGPAQQPAPPAPPPAAPPPTAEVRVPPAPAGARHEEPRRSRTPLVVLAVIVALALLGGAVAAVVAFVTTEPESPPHTAATSGPAPTSAPAGAPVDLRLRDDGTSITLTWTDPSGGSAPFVVAGGRADQGYRPLQSLGSGHTTYTLNGLDPTVEYCFLVAAIYSGQLTVPSNPVCTRRHSSPSATHSR